MHVYLVFVIAILLDAKKSHFQTICLPYSLEYIAEFLK